MKVWIFMVGILILAVTCFMFMNEYKMEGFLNLGDWFQNQNTFMKNQTNHYWNDDKIITVNNNQNFAGINNALLPPDLFKQATVFPEGKKDYTSYFQEESELVKDIQSCTELTSPTQINRGTTQKLGCGWVYSDDDTKSSGGAFGEFKGPSFQKEVDKRVENGEWMWSKNDAIKKEKIKRCRQIKTCPGITGVNAAGGTECGFCNDTNMRKGVPIKNGLAEFNDDEVRCTNLITNTGLCPSTALSTGTVGGGSLNPDCNAANWVDKFDDETQTMGTYNTVTDKFVDLDSCGRPVGNIDSSSAADISEDEAADENRILGGSVPGNIASPNVCDIVNGKLPKNCFIAKATEAGFLANGRLIQILNSKFENIKTENDLPFDEDKMAYKTLQNVITGLNLSIFGGLITVDALALLYVSIANQIVSATSSKRVKDAAKWFKDATAFEKCEYQDTENGPFLLQCMRQEFRKAGCQPSGTAHPNTNNQNTYNANTWGQLKTTFGRIYNDMTPSGSKFQKQDEAVRKCLGTDIYRPRMEACNEFGLEYIFYKATAGGGRGDTFLGRIISKNGSLPYKTGCGQWDQLFPITRKYFPQRNPGCTPTGPRSIQVIRTVRTPRKDEMLSFRFYKDRSNLPLIINNIRQPNSAFKPLNSHGLGRYEIKAPKDESTIIKFVTQYEHGFPLEDFNAQRFKDFQLLQDSWRPVVGFDFFKNEVKDSNDILAINNPRKNYTYGEDSLTAERKRGYLNVSTSNIIHTNITNQISDDAFVSITGCIFVNNGNSNNGIANLFGMNYSNNTSAYRIRITMSSATQFKIEMIRNFTVKDGTSSEKMYGQNRTVEVTNIDTNKWIHFTIIFKERSMTLTVKGSGADKTNSVTHNIISGTKEFPVSLFHNTAGSSINFKFAWLHFYDYQLNAQEIDRDMNYDNDDYIMPTAPTITQPQFACQGVRWAKSITGGTGIGNMRTGTNLTQCCDLCNSNPNCKGFAVDTKYNFCSLFSGNPQYQDIPYQNNNARNWVAAYIKP